MLCTELSKLCLDGEIKGLSLEVDLLVNAIEKVPKKNLLSYRKGHTQALRPTGEEPNIYLANIIIIYQSLHFIYLFD